MNLLEFLKQEKVYGIVILDFQLQKAFEIEKTGNFKKALDTYLIIDSKNLTTEDNLFLDRSISACLFYLKDYENAEKHFAEILENYDLKSFEQSEIQDSINLCYLYGGQAKKAEEYFLKKIENKNLSDDEKCWAYWYLGQANFLMKEYERMENFYMQNTILAKKMSHERLTFFLAHLMVAEILNKKYEDVEKNLKTIKKSEDKTFGLLKIVESIYKKLQGEKDWESFYKEGINEAKENKYLENIELGEFLKNQTEL